MVEWKPQPKESIMSTPIPGTSQTATKAIVGAAYSGVVAFLSTLTLALSDNAVSGLEWVGIASATVIAIGGSAGLVYHVPNQPK